MSSDTVMSSGATPSHESVQDTSNDQCNAQHDGRHEQSADQHEPQQSQRYVVIEPRRKFTFTWSILAIFGIQFGSAFLSIGIAKLLSLVHIYIPKGNVAMIFVLAITTVITFGFMAIFGGWRSLALKKIDLLHALRHSWYFLALALIQLGISLSEILSYRGAILGNWPQILLEVCILCIFVGISEEAMFRGIVVGGFLSRYSKTKAGFYTSIMLSALIFGLMHLTPTDRITPLVLSQYALKVLQTGMLALFFSALALEYKSFWGAALLHFLWDFFLLAGPSLIQQSLEPSYIETGSQGFAITIFYVVIIVLQIPIVVHAFRRFAHHTRHLPYVSWFSRTSIFEGELSDMVLTSAGAAVPEEQFIALHTPAEVKQIVDTPASAPGAVTVPASAAVTSSPVTEASSYTESNSGSDASNNA